MQLDHLGEFGFIRRIDSIFDQTKPKGVEGIGNDCAIIPYKNNTSFLVTTDLLIENIHFLKDKIFPHDLGYKSLAVNLSDIAAMGGQPAYAFLSLGIPPETTVEWADGFLKGFKDLAGLYQVYLLGGDTTRSDKIVINVVIMGTIKNSAIKRRSQAKPGDFICCTGFLGDSGAGLRIILDEMNVNFTTQNLIQAHYCPRPHIEEGQWLAAHSSVHAMMDISDGLDSDIRHLMKESHCGAHIELNDVPLSEDLVTASKLFNWSEMELALTAGEDYCLLLTVDPKAYVSLNMGFQKKFQRPLYHIGVMTTEPELFYTNNNQPYKIEKTGFDHFKSC